jgi:FkbM family methyltransferase
VSYISRAQNFEDFRLFRAFRDISKGNYIDIGAWDPVYHSVSYNFYASGWRGVNIEPSIESFLALEKLRPSDININRIVTTRTEETRFFTVQKSGLSTQHKEYLDNLNQDLVSRITENLVQPISLMSIFNQVGWDEIQWLKIDVEGSEEDVLVSWGDSPTRPLVVVVEATIPSSPQLSEANWENELFSRGYVKTYFDGLNNFYCLEGSDEIQKLISSPISIFDDVITYEEHLRKQILEKVLQSDVTRYEHNEQGFLGQPQIETYVSKVMNLYATNEKLESKQEKLTDENRTLEATIEKLESKQEKLTDENRTLEATNRDLTNTLSQMRSTKLFRYSTPLRWVWSLILRCNPRELSRVILVRIAARIIKKPLVKKFVFKLIPIQFLYRLKRFLKKEEQISMQQKKTGSDLIVDPKIDSLLQLLQGIEK